MHRQRRLTLALLFSAAALLCRFALADAYDPPASYYNTATGSGSTLKGQLYSIVSTGFVGRSYGDSRDAFALLDQDPNNANNILLVYNRGSVNGTWDSGVTFNREHVWPKFWLGLSSSQVTNSYVGVGSDLFELRPSDPNINSSRGDYGYGTTSVSAPHLYGVVSDGSGTYWYPGDADRGDVARSIFYMATRYGQNQTNNLSLVNGQPATYQFGDLASLLKWNYEDVPDNFERRRNQYVYSSSLNPTYYQGNRNPYIDHPEWVWSVYVNQTNDSQIKIASPTTSGSDGSSTKTVDLGRVLVGSAVPAAQAFTLNKAGNNGTYFSVTTSGAATSSLSGPFNAFRTNQTDSKSITVGLNTNTTSAGLRSGSVTIDNLDITTGGGAGHGANDANDTFNVSLNVLDHAKPSFASPTQTLTLTHDFGNIALGSSSPSFGFSIFDLNVTAGFTAGLDLDSITPSGNSSAFTTDLAVFSNLAANSGRGFTSSLNLTSVGTFSATYTLALSDENVPGAAPTSSLSLTLTGKVRLAGDFNGDAVVDSGDYLIWRRTLGQTGVPLFSGADGDGNGTINDADFDVWRQHFGQTESSFGAGLDLSAAVPEPATLWLAIVSLCLFSLRRVRSV